MMFTYLSYSLQSVFRIATKEILLHYKGDLVIPFAQNPKWVHNSPKIKAIVLIRSYNTLHGMPPSPLLLCPYLLLFPHSLNSSLKGPTMPLKHTRQNTPERLCPCCSLFSDPSLNSQQHHIQNFSVFVGHSPFHTSFYFSSACFTI